VDAFVNELSDLVRQATVREIVEALNATTGDVAGRRAGFPAKTSMARDRHSVAIRQPGSPSKAPIAARRAGQRRAPELLAQFTQGVHSYIKAHPGQGVGPIAVSVGTSTRDLSLVLRKLLDEKKITSTGKKRGTRYFPN